MLTLEMGHKREEGHCCGSVLTLIKEPDVAADIGKVRVDEAIEVGADKILALCPCCQFQMRVTADNKNMPVEIVDLARYAAGNGTDDAIHGESSRRFESDETYVPHPLPQAVAVDDAESHADHAGRGGRTHPHARLYARTDGGDDAQGHGQPHATHDW